MRKKVTDNKTKAGKIMAKVIPARKKVDASKQQDLYTLLVKRLKRIKKKVKLSFFQKLTIWIYLIIFLLTTFGNYLPRVNINPNDLTSTSNFQNPSNGVEVAPGVWKNPPKAPNALPDPIKQVIAAGPKEDLNIKEKSTKGLQNDTFRWVVNLSNGTRFMFGKETKEGILPVVEIDNSSKQFISYSPKGFEGLVKPEVKGNVISWEIAKGITARYTVKNDRVKEDLVVNSKEDLKNFPDFNLSYSKDLKSQDMPNGDISFLGKGDEEVFTIPAPVVFDANKKEVKGTYDLVRNVLSINFKASILAFPITVDPVVIDASGVDAAGATQYANGRKLIRDGWGNLIAMFAGGSSVAADDVYYKAYNSTSWTDAAITLTTSASSREVASDIDAAGNIHVATHGNLQSLGYVKLTVTRNGANAITSISKGTVLLFDASTIAARPSLIVANKGGGTNVEKVAVAWAVNSITPATKVGEIRFIQCSVSDDCSTADNWKNASNERNGTGGTGSCSNPGTGSAGLPSSTTTCRGAADQILSYTTNYTTHHAVLSQMPGKPKRSPTKVWQFTSSGSTYTDLTNTYDNSSGTTSVINFINTNYLYIGDDQKFSKVSIDIASGFTGALMGSLQYWNGSTWTSVSNLTNGTQFNDGASKDLQQDGSFLFDEPTSWTKTSVNSSNKYWIRLSTDDIGSVTVADFYLTDRNSKALVISAGVDDTDDLGTSYVVWDEINNNGWEANGNAVGAPWRSNTTALDTLGANWTTFTNFPLSAVVDYKNNALFVAWAHDSCGTACQTNIKSIANNLDPTVSGNWKVAMDSTTTVISNGTATLSLSADGANIYLFWTDGASGLKYKACYPDNPAAVGFGTGNICDNSLDWDTNAKVLDSTTTLIHPQAVLSKATGDNIAIDVIYSNTFGATSISYERVYINNADASSPKVVAASGNDATHCTSNSEDYQQIATTQAWVGHITGPTYCGAAGNEAHNSGFQFTNISVSQGAVISSAYIDIRVSEQAGTPTFSIYGEDVNSSSTFALVDPCDSTCLGNRVRTTSVATVSAVFSTNSYRFDVTKIVQEIVCRGASNSQPCVGNFNKSGSWASGNNLSILFINGSSGTNYIGIDTFDSTKPLKPTLQINVASNESVGTSNKINDAGNPGAMAGAGRQVVRTSGGTLYSSVIAGSTCGMWKSTDGVTWVEQDSAHKPGCQSYQAIAIDSSGIIHIVHASGSRTVDYDTFSTSTNLFVTRDSNIINNSFQIQGVSITVDSNDKPHIAVLEFDVDGVGTYYLRYRNKISGSWSTAVTPSSSNFLNGGTDITIDKDNKPEIIWSQNVDGPEELHALIGNLNNATSFTDATVSGSIGSAANLSVGVDSSGNTWIAYPAVTTGYISLAEHVYGASWSTWTSVSDSRAGTKPSVVINGSAVYVFYQNASNNIVYDRYNTVALSWLGEKVLHSGTYQDVHAKWSYLNDNKSSTGIDYLYSDGTDIYYNRLTFVSVTGLSYSLGSATQLATGSASVLNLDHPFSSVEYGAVASNDTNYASVSATTQYASGSAQPAMMFKVNNSNNNNAYKIDASVIAKSTNATSNNPAYLQVYRGGSTNNWVTMATNNNTAANTDFTMTSPTIISSTSEYYFASGNSYTATSATNPGTVVDDNSVGTQAWSNPSNATTSDNSYATASFGSPPRTSHFLKATNFGFSVPTTAAISGVKVEIERSANVGSQILDSDVYLVKGGAVSGLDKADTVSYWPTSDAYATYGGPNDTWQVGLTPSDVNSSNFGVSLDVTNAGGTNVTPSVDHIRITVYYTTDDMWSYWRVYQDAPAANQNEVLLVNQATVTYSPNGPDKVAFTNAARTFTAGCGGSGASYVIQLQSGSTPTNPLATTVVQVTTNSPGTFGVYSDSSCTSAISGGNFTFTTSDNTSSTFYIKDTRKSASTWTLTAARTSGDTLTSGTQTYTVNAGTATSLIITLPGESFTDGSGNSGGVTNQTAGTQFAITKISAVDGFNNVDPTYSGVKTVAYSGPSNAPDTTPPSYTTSVTFASGQSTTTLNTTLYKAETHTIGANISADSLSGTSSSLTVGTGSVTGTNSTVTGSSTVNANTSMTVTITLEDAYQNLKTSYSGANISLSNSTGTGFIINSGPSDTNGSGVSTASVQWNQAGSKVVKVDITGDGQLTNTLSVTVGANPSNTSIGGGTIIRGGSQIR